MDLRRTDWYRRLTLFFPISTFEYLSTSPHKYMFESHRDSLLGTFDISLLEEHVGQSVPTIAIGRVKFDLLLGKSTLLWSIYSADF